MKKTFTKFAVLFSLVCTLIVIAGANMVENGNEIMPCNDLFFENSAED